MKKDIEWLKENITKNIKEVKNENYLSYFGKEHARTIIGTYEVVLDLIDQLDEPERTLEQEAVDELIEKYSKDEMSTYYVKVEREKFVKDLQNLLVPRQE